MAARKPRAGALLTPQVERWRTSLEQRLPKRGRNVSAIAVAMQHSGTCKAKGCRRCSFSRAYLTLVMAQGRAKSELPWDAFDVAASEAIATLKKTSRTLNDVLASESRRGGGASKGPRLKRVDRAIATLLKDLQDLMDSKVRAPRQRRTGAEVDLLRIIELILSETLRDEEIAALLPDGGAQSGRARRVLDRRRIDRR